MDARTTPPGENLDFYGREKDVTKRQKDALQKDWRENGGQSSGGRQDGIQIGSSTAPGVAYG